MIPQTVTLGTLFVVRFYPLPWSILAVLIYPWLFVNELYRARKAEAVAWAGEMAGRGESEGVMRVR